MLKDPRQLMLYCVAITWMVIGVVLAGIAGFDIVAGLETDGDTLLLAGLLAVAAVVASSMEIRFGQQQIELMLDGVPLLLAAFYLPWQYAVLIAFLSQAWAMREFPKNYGRFGTFAMLYNCANSATAMGVTGFVAHRWLDQDPVLLPAALAASLCMELVYDAFFPVIGELYQRGSARKFVENAKITILASILMPTLGIVILSPFVGNPLLVMVMLAAVQGMLYFGLWVANSEQLQRKKNVHLLKTFSRYVPAGIVENNVDEMRQVELGGEQRDISVLFCDVRGFTSWSENKEPQEIVTELNALLSELTQAVFTTTGTLDKFTGDGLMAFWGAPLEQPDHADRACSAALEMVRRVEDLNEIRMAAGEQPFAIGIGVHSGHAVVGNVGHEDRLDYTAIGDTVNLAARLEGATKEIGNVFLISQETHASLSAPLQKQALRIGSISVKGRKREVEIYGMQPMRPEDLSEAA